MPVEIKTRPAIEISIKGGLQKQSVESIVFDAKEFSIRESKSEDITPRPTCKPPPCRGCKPTCACREGADTLLPKDPA